MHRARQPQVRGVAGLNAAEAWFGDANDLELTTFPGVVPHEPAPNDPGIAAEPLHPERVAEYRHWMRAGLSIILHRQEPAGSRADAELFEYVAGDELHAHGLPLSTRPVECHAGFVRVSDGEQVNQSAAGLAHPNERRVAEHVVFRRVGAGICQIQQALGLVHWERSEDQRVDEGK